MLSAKWKELPLFTFDLKDADRLEKFEYNFDYELQFNSTTDINLGVKLPSDSKIKQTEFKFDIGWGKLIFSIDYLTKSSLGGISEKIVQHSSNANEENKDEDSFVLNEDADEYAADPNLSSRPCSNVDDSDEFVLITTYENLEDEIKANNDAKAEKDKKLVAKQEIINIPSEDHKHSEVHKPPRIDKCDDFKFDSAMLFKNKSACNQDLSRDRCFSDTTAWDRFKNILNIPKSKFSSKALNEYKSSIPPINLTINESHFGEDDHQNVADQLSRIKHNDFQDETMNPFGGFKTGRSNDSDASRKDSGSTYQKLPAFNGLREFRLSIDGTDDPQLFNRPKLSPVRSHHRKFALSFDGNNQAKKEISNNINEFDYDIFNAFDESIHPVLESIRQKKPELAELEDDNSFEIHIEDNHFADDLSGFEDHNKFNSKINGSKNDENKNSTDLRRTRVSTQDSNNLTDQLFSESPNTDDVLIFLKQDSTDTWVNNLSSEDEFSAFLVYLDKLKNRIEQSLHKEN